MRIRNNKNADNELNMFDRYLTSKEQIQDFIKENKGKKINLEIGMGKGKFIEESAHKNKDEVFIGVELCKSVLALAIKKIVRFEAENNESLDNLVLTSFDASDLLEYFELKQIDNIFLNFSDPWPKKRHSKRRLTSECFLELYSKILKKEGKINFKTDNRGLFEYSLLTLNNFGIKFEEIYLDLHSCNVENIETEYENKFSKLGPIYKIVCSFEKN